MQLSFESSGPSDGPAIVLLHGLTSSRESYSDIAPALTERDRRVLAVDLRGHGQSPHGTRYRASDYAADVVRLIEAEGAAPATVIGHSLGGLAGSALAATAPDLVAGLLLEDPPLFEGDDAIRNGSAAARFFPGFLAQIERWQADGTEVADMAAVLTRLPTPHGTTAGERFGTERIQGRARALKRFDPTAMRAAIGGDMWIGYDPTAAMPCPLTVLAADPAVGAVFLPEHGEWLTDAVPHARIVTFDGQGHGIHEDPDGRGPYLEAVERFLGELG